MPKVTIYTTEYCGICERAKSLLKSRGIAFDEVFIGRDDDAKWDELFARSGMRTMPQIYSDDALVGGYLELRELDQKDGLKSLGAK